MATSDVAEGLVGLCKTGAFREAIEKYYGDDIVSVEPMGEPAEVRGLSAVLAKADWWDKSFEIHGVEVEGPYTNGEYFAVRFKLDATNKMSGERNSMDEIALYEVKDGKIVHERFLYGG